MVLTVLEGGVTVQQADCDCRRWGRGRDSRGGVGVGIAVTLLVLHRETPEDEREGERPCLRG